MYTQEEAQETFRLEMERKKQLHQQAETLREEIASRKKAEALAEIARRKQSFEAQVEAFSPDMETVLSSQAQMLHGVFTHALGEYIGSGAEEGRAKLYGAIALRAQNYCRMTLSAAFKLKQQRVHATVTRKNANNEEQPIIRSGNEALDTGGTPKAGGTNPSLATLEGAATQNMGLPAGEPT